MNTQSLANRVKQIEIFAKKHVEGLFSGMYASAFKGQGVEVDEIREFREGDDVRSISWTKTASMGRPFVKEFREERDLTVMLVIDTSRSMKLGFQETKQDLVAQIAALLAFSAIYNHDRVGLILYSDKLEKYIKPKRGIKHGARLIREFLAFESGNAQTDLKGALKQLYTSEPKRAIVFFLSDFIDEGYEKLLSLNAKKNDLIAIRVHDERESTLPPIGRVTFQDLETGRQTEVCVNSRFSRVFKEKQLAFAKETAHTIRKTGSGFIDISTKEPFINKLREYFNARKKRR